MLLELHIIQNFAPANLNRDDSGMPKDCEFGGHRRARISSQCLKSNIRKYFKDNFFQDLGFRTKRIYEKFMEDLQSNDFSETDLRNLSMSLTEMLNTSKPKDIEGAIRKKLYKFYDIDTKDKEKKTTTSNNPEKVADVLFFTNDEEIRKISDSLKKVIDNDFIDKLKLIDLNKNKKSIDEFSSLLKNYFSSILNKLIETDLQNGMTSIDIALFGRMLAARPRLNIDAACQVAHAISTHKVSMDFDYFTAIDDLNPNEETGAGMIGNLGFNSSCFYRYVSLDVAQLMANIGNKKDLAVNGILGFVEGTLKAIPTGKRNSFASNNPPSFAMITIAKDIMPISLANAFEKPIRPGSKLSLSKKSTKKMLKHFEQLKRLYNLKYDKILEFGIKLDENDKPLEMRLEDEFIADLESYLNNNL